MTELCEMAIDATWYLSIYWWAEVTIEAPIYTLLTILDVVEFRDAVCSLDFINSELIRGE